MHARQTPSGLEIITRNPAAWADGIPFHPVPADQQALIDRNWVCVDGVFSPPTDTYLAEQAQRKFDLARAQRLAQARAAVDAAAQAMLADVPAFEQHSWPIQLAEAQALQAAQASAGEQPVAEAAIAPLLSGLAVARAQGESVSALADKVLAAAARHQAAIGPLLGRWQGIERALLAAPSLDALYAVEISPTPA